jgi:hypothetical protein
MLKAMAYSTINLQVRERLITPDKSPDLPVALCRACSGLARHCVMAQAPPLKVIFHGKTRHLSGGGEKWRDRSNHHR